MAAAGTKSTPEGRARETIDALLEQSGWVVQDRDDMNLTLPAVAVREFKLERGHGYADYLLFVDGRAVGVCEAKKAGTLVRNVEVQSKKYVDGLPTLLRPAGRDCAHTLQHCFGSLTTHSYSSLGGAA